MLSQAISAHELKHDEPTAETKFSNWIRYWLTEVEKRVDVITHQGYETNAKAHVLPYFDKLDVALSDVNLKGLQAYIDYEVKHGRRDGKGGVSPTSLRHYKNIVNQALNLAVRDGIIMANPCTGVVLPKMERYDYQFYNAEQLQTLLEAVKGDMFAPLIRVAILYGLRRSELLGLQ